MDVNTIELSKLVTNKEDLFRALTYSELESPLLSTKISQSVCSTAGKLYQSNK